MEDDRAKNLARVLGNKTCKKIIDFLSEKEASEKDIADSLKVPINTIEYNLKKLLEAELIEKSRNFFWSRKGKRIDVYKLSNKSIIIAPKNSEVSSKLKSLLPAVFLTGAITFLIYAYEKTKLVSTNVLQKGAEVSVTNADNFYSSPVEESVRFTATNIFTQPHPVWIWFLAGALLSLLIISIVNWRKL